MKQILVFTKFRLSFLVVLSALSGYLFVGGNDYLTIFYLMLGGTLVTAAANGANQIWEREHDEKMNRTSKRPLVTGNMRLATAYFICIFSLVLGSALLAIINWNSLVLGLFAFVSYVFIYTPMKRKSPWAVFIGAFPGAIPPMLGAIAHTSDFGFLPGILFFIQFTWQFPHFWAIAWVTHEDYQKAGFFLLPTRSGKSKSSAFLIALYSIMLIPFSLIPWLLDCTGTATLFIAGILGIWFFFLAYKLYISCEDKDAKRLMFASFLYLPVIQFTYVFDKSSVVIKQYLTHGLF